MRREFLPYNFTRLLYQQLQNLKQGSKSVDYSYEFYSLVARNETQDQLVVQYISGLRLPFHDQLNLIASCSLSDAHQRASLLERQCRWPPAASPLLSKSVISLAVSRGIGPTPARVRPALLADDQVDEGYTGPPIFYQEPPIEDDVAHLQGDVGEALVVRSACLTSFSNSALAQRTNIFSSTCTVNDKICKFIIDLRCMRKCCFF